MCVENGPPCEEFWKTPVVFTGRVESVTKITRQERGPQSRVRFRVIEAFRGTNATEIDIFSNHSTCDVGFREGSEWIVYAFPRYDGPGLTTTVCSRTRLLVDGGEDLSYARAVYSRKPGTGRIFGSLTYSINEGNGFRPIRKVEITVIDPTGASSVVTTNEQGRFEVSAWPGLSQLTPTLPRGMSFGTVSVELLDSRGCAVTNLVATYSGRLVGQVLDASKVPVPNVAVELVQPNMRDSPFSRRRTLTDARGRFEMSDVKPGVSSRDCCWL